MSKVALVTDSTAVIPKELVEKYHISVVPQVLIWGEKTYEDGVDITPEEFYTRLKGAPVMPTTSQATPKSFKQIFEPLVEAGYEILAILVSEQLSGTIASAVQAKEQFPGATIEIFDSCSAAMAMGFQVLAAGRAAQEGASLAECLELAEKARDRTGVIFAVDTLEFLHRGGRIGGAARLFGTALNLKPILEIRGGRVEPVDRVRTRKKSINRVLEILETRINGKQPLRLAPLHANAPEEANEIMEMVQARFNPDENILTDVSPVVGNHAGPGTVGVAYMVGI